MKNTDRILRADFRATKQAGDVSIKTTAVNAAVTFINEITMAPKRSLTLDFESGISLLIIPLFGGVGVGAADEFLGTGYFRTWHKPERGAIIITNPYEDHNVQLLAIGFSQAIPAQSGTIAFDRRNVLFSIMHTSPSVHTGIYDGRTDGFYESAKNTDILAFSIHGAFEFENRLLEARDALYLSDLKKIGFEALSQDAILLLFDLG